MTQKTPRQVTDRFGPALSVAGAVVNIGAGVFVPGLAPAIATEAVSRVIESVGRRADQRVRRARSLEDLGDLIHRVGIEVQGISKIATDLGESATRAEVYEPLPMTREEAAMLRSRRRRLNQLVSVADRASLRAVRHMKPEDIDKLGPLLSELRKNVHEMNCDDVAGISVGEKIRKIENARQSLDIAIKTSL